MHVWCDMELVHACAWVHTKAKELHLHVCRKGGKLDPSNACGKADITTNCRGTKRHTVTNNHLRWTISFLFWWQHWVETCPSWDLVPSPCGSSDRRQLGHSLSSSIKWNGTMSRLNGMRKPTCGKQSDTSVEANYSVFPRSGKGFSRNLFNWIGSTQPIHNSAFACLLARMFFTSRNSTSALLLRECESENCVRIYCVLGIWRSTLWTRKPQSNFMLFLSWLHAHDIKIITSNRVIQMNAPWNT